VAFKGNNMLIKYNVRKHSIKNGAVRTKVVGSFKNVEPAIKLHRDLSENKSINYSIQVEYNEDF